jgi:hypothetical protein
MGIEFRNIRTISKPGVVFMPVILAFRRLK